MGRNSETIWPYVLQRYKTFFELCSFVQEYVVPPVSSSKNIIDVCKKSAKIFFVVCLFLADTPTIFAANKEKLWQTTD
jgi:hypothetical protein